MGMAKGHDCSQDRPVVDSALQYITGNITENEQAASTLTNLELPIHFEQLTNQSSAMSKVPPIAANFSSMGVV